MKKEENVKKSNCLLFEKNKKKLFHSNRNIETKGKNIFRKKRKKIIMR